MKDGHSSRKESSGERSYGPTPAPEHKLGVEPTETLDLTTLFVKDLTKSGSFDIREIKRTAFGKILLALPVPACLIDKSYSMTFCNEAWKRLSPDYEKLVGTPLFSIFSDAEEAEAAHALAETVLKERTPKLTEGRLLIHGRQFWVRICFRSVRLAAERLILVLLEDLTAEKRQLLLMNEIDQAKQEWEQTFDTVPDRIILISQDYKIKRLNKKASDSLGRTFEEVRDQSCYKVLHGRDYPPAFCPHSRMLDDGEEHVAEYYDEIGQVWWLESVSPIRDTHGKVISSVIVDRDVTERKRAEELLRKASDELESRVNERTFELLEANTKLQEEVSRRMRVQEALSLSEERFRAIVETATDCIFIKDTSLKYRFVNPSFRIFLGLSESSILGRTEEALFGETSAKHIHDIDSRVLAGEVVEEQLTRLINGNPTTFLEIRTPLRDRNGDIGGICGISRDITERSDKQSLTRPCTDQFPSVAMRAAIASARLAAEHDTTILLTGESGSGKDYLARYIHDHSSRSSGPYYVINCAAVPRELAESELFGHESGAFTGARGRKRGLVQLAEGGTLLLNEVSELTLPLQAKLLTFLDTKTFIRLGGESSLKVNVRLMAATNSDLQTAVSQNLFRRDLFYRLNVFSIRVPALKERIEDIPLLVNMILNHLAAQLQLSKPPKVDPASMKRMCQYAWPGNVRELRNVLERALILSKGKSVSLSHINLGPS